MHLYGIIGTLSSWNYKRGGGYYMLKHKRLFLGVLVSIFLYGVLNETPIFAQDDNIETSRLSGANRYTTSADISKEGWTQSTTVIIATGRGYADALAASSLAKLKNAPILLTQASALNANVITEIKRLKASQAILVGGTGVIGNGVENQLKSLNVGITRVNGTDRYDTSRKVAEMVGVNNGIIMATGLDYPDALSIAPISGIKAIPILLTPKDSMNLGVEQFIKSKGVPVSYIVGGTGVICSAIASSLPHNNRLGGSNRYETNLIINKKFENDLNFDTIYLATGSDFPDAVAGSALAAKNNAPIFLVGNDSISSEIISFLISKNVKHVVALGGTDVVSDKIVSDITKGIAIKPSSISLNKIKDTLIVKSTSTLIETIAPSNAANKSVTWTSSNDKIATVDSNGKVTAVSAGTATITVKTVDGNKIASCVFTVNTPLEVTSIY
jgi:putative cell wall-binding protein